MRAAKRPIAIVVSISAIAWLLYSSLCNLDCSLTLAKPLERSEHARHCHHKQDAQDQTSTAGHIPSAPYNHKGHDNCPSHVDATALMPAGAGASTALHYVTHAAAYSLPYVIYVSFDEARPVCAGDISFRSPPKRAVLTSLRF
jgi:hypothetical protein